MPDPITALVVGGSQLRGSTMQAKAAGEAADIQSGAAQAGIDGSAASVGVVSSLCAAAVAAAAAADGG